MLVVLCKEEEGRQGQRSEKEADHARGWHGVGLGGKGTGQMSKVSWLYMLSIDPTRGATPAQDVPARHDNDILSDTGHLLNGQVAHAAECGLKDIEKTLSARWERIRVRRSLTLWKAVYTDRQSCHHPVMGVLSAEMHRLVYLHH